MIISFGKHKGSDITKVPDSYLEWGAENLSNPTIKKAFSEEIGRRKSKIKSMRDRLKIDPEDVGARAFFLNQYTREFNEEVAESGCEWEYEYDRISPLEVADERLIALLAKLEKERRQEAIKADYLKRYPFLSDGSIDEVIRIYTFGTLDRERFSSEERYDLALQIVKDLELEEQPLEWQ